MVFGVDGGGPFSVGWFTESNALSLSGAKGRSSGGRRLYKLTNWQNE